MSPLDIHLIAIGGTGMAPLACLLQALGHRVRGSDGPLYPPMSTLLTEAGITPFVGYSPDHLEPAPDLVIVGNAVPRTHPEAEAVETRRLPRISMPEALHRFFLAERRPLVVAGTHGKTTTTSIAAWVYEDCGESPSYLVGGVPVNFEKSFHLGRGDRFVIEGDEYNAAYFDRGPKFLHYAPETLILTSVEYDHADLYPDHESLLVRYAELVEGIPKTGHLAACGDAPDVRKIAERASCPVTYYGLDEANDVRPVGRVAASASGSRLQVVAPGVEPIELDLPLFGDHNVTNALGVFATAVRDGIEPARIARALSRFRGVKRRMEVVGELRCGAGGEVGKGRAGNGRVGRTGDSQIGGDSQITVIDDFAHHPTAVAATLAAARQSYPDRRIVAAYEPRSLTAGREFLHTPYLDAFSKADRVFFAPIFHHERLGDERIDLDRLTAELRERGIDADTTTSHEELLARLSQDVRRGDVVVTMSSGSFEGLPGKLVAALETSQRPALA